MDLVSVCFSDDEMENHTNIKKTVKKDNGDKKSSNNSNTLDIFEKDLSTAVKSQKPTNDEIECICLDDSDSENIEISISPKPSKSNVTFPTIKEETSKKIDYLNLESSDTDDEQERIQNNVNNLLSSAAILNDIECGPAKPVAELDICTKLASFTNQIPLGIKRSSSPSVSVINDHDDNSSSTLLSAIDVPGKICSQVDSSNKKNHSDDSALSSAADVSGSTICSQEDLCNKKIKSDPHTADSKDVDVNTFKGPDPRITMYRKDDRIVAAYKKKGASHIPSTLSQTIFAHEKAVSSLSWCAVPYSHLLLSSSLDCTVKVWDIYSQNKPIQTIQIPLGARAAKWSKNGETIMAGGFGKQLHVIDALSGKTHMMYKVNSYISCIAIHPFIEDVILCGTQNAVLGFDLRVDEELPVRTFLSKGGEVLDIAFLNKNEFVCSNSVVSHDSANRTIMVWDFNSGAIMSNQIFLERYTCPSLKINTFDSSFIAQTNGDYIAAFSSQRPYKIKNKRYMGHKVSGFGIECDISPDGQYIASGDAKGDVYFYNYGDTKVVNKLTLKPNVPTNKLQWHPVLSSTIAVATWDGKIHVWK